MSGRIDMIIRIHGKMEMVTNQDEAEDENEDNDENGNRNNDSGKPLSKWIRLA